MNLVAEYLMTWDAACSASKTSHWLLMTKPNLEARKDKEEDEKGSEREWNDELRDASWEILTTQNVSSRGTKLSFHIVHTKLEN